MASKGRVLPESGVLCVVPGGVLAWIPDKMRFLLPLSQIPSHSRAENETLNVQQLAVVRGACMAFSCVVLVSAEGRI